MTKQEIFDKVVTHLGRQNKLALDKFGTCQYRGEGGTMCAVGCLIPDELYNKLIEGVSVARIIKHEDSNIYEPEVDILSNILSELFGDDEELYYLLADLQRVHDDCREGTYPYMKKGFRKVANKYNLDDSKV